MDCYSIINRKCNNVDNLNLTGKHLESLNQVNTITAGCNSVIISGRESETSMSGYVQV